MKVVGSLILLIILVPTGKSVTRVYQEANRPIPEDGLIRLIENKVPRMDLIRAVQTHSVAFQLTSVFEQELTRAGQYLGPNVVAALLMAIRANFRPPTVRPYRLTYRLLRGHAVDLLLDGEIGRWESELNGKYFIVQNETFRTLADLVARFSQEFDGDKFVRLDGPRRTTRTLAAQYKKQKKLLFVGSSGTGIDQSPDWIVETVGHLQSWRADDFSALVSSLSNSNRQWNLEVIHHKTADTLIFRKYSQKGDLSFFEDDPLHEFYSYITKDYLPPDFGIVELSVDEKVDLEGCGHHALAPRDLRWRAQFLGPLLRVNVAIIENISQEPMTVGRFILKENHSEQLQERLLAQTGLESQPAKKEYLFGPGILKPGESLVVPLELSMKTEKPDLEEFLGFPQKPNASIFNDLIARAKSSKGLNFRDNYGNEVPSVSAEALERIAKNDKLDLFSTKEYIYGPLVTIESLEINKFGYLVRKFDPSRLLITHGYDGEQIGSCPFVYTSSAREKTWLREGVILAGYNAKLKESTDEIVLRNFNGRVLIREEEMEDSFIDSIRILAISVDV